MDTKTSDFSYFFKKGENARNYCIYNRKRGSGHSKLGEKPIENRSTIHAPQKTCNDIVDAERHRRTPDFWPFQVS